MKNADVDIRSVKESYVTVALHDKKKIGYPRIVEAMKRTRFKLDDIVWGRPTEFKGKRKRGSGSDK